MISKNQIKLLNSLKNSKFRQKHSLFVIEGPKVFSEYVKTNFKIKDAFVIEEVYEDYASKYKNIDFTKITELELKKISNLKTPNQIIASVEIKPEKQFAVSEKLYLMLESVRDPGNLGTIIRTADWFGFDEVICSSDCVDALNPKVIQSAMGSSARVNLIYTDIYKLINKSDLPAFATHLDGQNIYKSELSNRGFIVLGNESNGISKKMEKLISKKLFIPNYNNSNAESLNVSIATALVCAEFRRRFTY